MIVWICIFCIHQKLLFSDIALFPFSRIKQACLETKAYQGNARAKQNEREPFKYSHTQRFQTLDTIFLSLQ